MEPRDFAKVLEQQQQATIAAQGRKGERATNKFNRLQLERIFALSAAKPTDSMRHIRTCFIGLAYPPSITPLQELEPIGISDLRLETNHKGKVLVVRTFAEPYRLVAVQNAVDDARGSFDRLAVYNFDPLRKARDVLPNNGVFAIKEPYYKATADRGYTIRVDHPSDLIKLEPGHPLIPAAMMPRVVEIEILPVDLKTNGNTAYLAKDYIKALDLYSRGITSCGPADSLLRRDLLRNRSIVNLLLMRYEAAESDARAAIIPASEAMDGDKTKQYNTKAWFRAGQAAYQSGEFKQAEQYFAHALEVSPHDKDTLHERNRVTQRLRETETGGYDFAEMRNSNKKCLRLDYASYTKLLAKRNTERSGRGLFATEDIKAGDLLLCEKAHEAVFGSEETTDIVTIINLNTKRGNMGPHASLMSRVISKAHHNPKYAGRLLDLYDQGYMPKFNARQLDGGAVVDSFQIQSIVECNCFGCQDTHSIQAGDTPGADDGPSRSVGIWITASYINHDCIGNAHRSFIGDMMIVRACRDIAMDEEITMPYISCDSDPAKQEDQLHRSWGFKCTCVICLAEGKVSVPQRRDRQALAGVVGSFLAARKQSKSYQPDKATIRRAEELYKKLVGSYDDSLFEPLPRLGLVKLNHWLCQAYAASDTAVQAENAALRLLRNLGFYVSFRSKGGIMHVDRSYGVVQRETVDAAVYAAHANHFLGKSGIAEHFDGLARGLHRTLCGDLDGFDGRYGKRG